MHPDILTANELARRAGYSAPHGAFRRWLRLMGIRTVPGRRGAFCAQHVQRRIDARHDDAGHVELLLALASAGAGDDEFLRWLAAPQAGGARRRGLDA